jgi:CHAD domain-containing protein
MAFELRRGESPAEGVRRAAKQQLAKAVAELEGRGDGDLRAVVHGVRKRSKRVRAAARLVQADLGKDFKRTNVAVRDAARLLSPIRDAHALVGIFDALVAGTPEDWPRQDLLPVRAGLARRATAADERTASRAGEVDQATEGFRKALHLVKGWRLEDGDVAEGLRASYRDARRAYRAALADPSPPAFHEWRKTTKHVWYQTQLFEPAAPSTLTRQARSFHRLADALGDAHDLTVLTATLRDEEHGLGGAEVVTAAIALAEHRRADLERRSLLLGSRLHVETPKAYAARMTGLWDAWQEHGDEEPTGEIATVAPPEDDLDGRTRDQLYALAREVDLPGRSGLGRDELIAALRAQGR